MFRKGSGGQGQRSFPKLSAPDVHLGGCSEDCGLPCALGLLEVTPHSEGPTAPRAAGNLHLYPGLQATSKQDWLPEKSNSLGAALGRIGTIQDLWSSQPEGSRFPNVPPGSWNSLHCPFLLPKSEPVTAPLKLSTAPCCWQHQLCTPQWGIRDVLHNRTPTEPWTRLSGGKRCGRIRRGAAHPKVPAGICCCAQRLPCSISLRTQLDCPGPLWGWGGRSAFLAT